MSLLSFLSYAAAAAAFVVILALVLGCVSNTLVKNFRFLFDKTGRFSGWPET